MNMGVQLALWYNDFISSAIDPEMGLLDKTAIYL
jgi:hypothetical protein